MQGASYIAPRGLLSSPAKSDIELHCSTRTYLYPHKLPKRLSRNQVSSGGFEPPPLPQFYPILSKCWERPILLHQDLFLQLQTLIPGTSFERVAECTNNTRKWIVSSNVPIMKGVSSATLLAGTYSALLRSLIIITDTMPHFCTHEV